MKAKKILALVFLIFFLCSALCVTAHAAPPAKRPPRPEDADKRWNAGNQEVIGLIKAKKNNEALKKLTGLLDYLTKNKLSGGQEEATTYNNLGMVYLLLGNFEKANASLLKSLAMRDQIFGNTSLESATVWLNLSHLYKQQAQYIMGLHEKKTEPPKKEDPKAKKPGKK